MVTSICTACGAASAAGARTCAACGQVFAAQVAGRPGPALPPRPAVLPEGDESVPAQGSWGTGVPYSPTRAFGRADWRPALRAVLAPTALLFLAAFLPALTDYRPGGTDPSFTSRYGGSLALVLTALGAPWRLLRAEGATADPYSVEQVFHLLPMTVTAAWAALLGLGLWSGLRARQARGPLPQWAEVFAEATRVALVAGAVTLLTGLLSGADWTEPSAVPLVQGGAGQALGTRISAEASWPWAVGGAVLLAWTVAAAVQAVAALRSGARFGAVPHGWLTAGQVAGRALLVTVGTLSAAAFMLVAVLGNASLSTASLLVLPNLGLLLLGFGSGATLAAGSHAGGASAGDLTTDGLSQASLLDLGEFGGAWRFAVLAGLFGVLVLARCAHRRGLDLAGRLRLTAVYTAVVGALSAVSGLAVEATFGTAPDGSGAADPLAGSSQQISLSLGWSVLPATLAAALLGALALPTLLARAGGPRVPAPDTAVGGEPEPASEPAPVADAAPAGFLPPPTEVLDSDRRSG